MADNTIEFWLPGCTKSGNKMLREHWSKRSQRVKDYAYMIRKAVGSSTYTPINTCLLFLERRTHNKIYMDWENLSFSFKHLVDALTERHKFGVGLIVDDSPLHVLAHPTVVETLISKDEPERTIVKIVPMPD